MAFMQEGDIPVQITNAMLAQSTLNPNANPSIDVALEVTNQDGTQKDWWRANMSGDYTKISNRQGQTNTQVTYENLVNLGYQGPDFSQWPGNPNVDLNAVQTAIQSLVGVMTTAHCERSRCGKYINVKWLGGGSSTPVAVDLNALMGGGQHGAQQMKQNQQPVNQGGLGGQQQQAQGGFGGNQGVFGGNAGFGG